MADQKTIIWYTDAITALTRAARPLLVAIEAAESRGDEDLANFLRATYNPLVRKLRALADDGRNEEEWTASELNSEDATTFALLLAAKSKPIK